MTEIVIHAGMPKAGSSSIQRWLRRSSAALRGHGYTLVFAPPDDGGRVDFSPWQEGRVNSGWMVNRAVGEPGAVQQRTIDALVAGLASAADRLGDVVVSSESFALPFWTLHGPTLAGFQWLSTRYEVKVAYYARPQDSSMEAAWRQWGFRTGTEPSAYVDGRAAQLHYASTRNGVRELAPGLEFEPRPFREDMLDCGDVISDFAGRFLGIEVPPGSERANLGLPLEAINVLRAAPAGMFWDGIHDNRWLDRLKGPLAGEPLPEDDRVALSRLVLRKYAFERFAAGNAELGWEDFVRPPENGDRLPGIEALDELWTPQASPAELSLLFRALRAAIERRGDCPSQFQM